ncbi:MAG: hypothetical protein ACYTFT_06845 [Planctomycetota bacterium]
MLTAVSLSAGCSGDLIEPAMDIDDRRMLIVPFKDQAYFYYESAIGTRLARSISRRLEDERKEYDDDVIEVVAFEEIGLRRDRQGRARRRPLRAQPPGDRRAHRSGHDPDR